MTALLEKLLPVLLIITIGWILRKREIISASAINELKNIIVKVALPCILFLSFSKTALEARYIIIVVLVFGMCLALYSLGFLLRRLLPGTFGSFFTPWFMAGFEFGMIGVGLFAALWGSENLPLIMLIGLGHEFFAWFVMIPYIQFKNSGKFNLVETLGKFIRTPIILGIFGGLVANITGLYDILQTVFWGRSALSAMSTISNLGVPLILMVVGYSLVIEKDNARKIAMHIIARFSAVLTIGTAALTLIRMLAGPMDPLFSIAFYAFLILPPSYLVPIYVKNDEAERYFFSQAVVYCTIVSFSGYIVLMLV
ncbi:MAG TPA: AEC family transporter, partial [Anaerovoracaceae bacterium]|nr:AEC family transporter [Anaerovoracaceae bacterium]